MLNRTVLGSLILLVTSSASFAEGTGTGYIGGSLGMGYSTSYKNILEGDIYGGYGLLYGQSKRFYIGSELSLSTMSMNFDKAWYIGNMQWGYKTSRTSTTSLGVSLLPGYMITENTMFYGRIEGSFAPHDQSTVLYGLGLQTKLNNKWSVRLEESLTGYHYAPVTATKLGVVYTFN